MKKYNAILFHLGDQFFFHIGTKFFSLSSSRCVRLQICHDHQFLLTVTKERKKSDDGHNYDRIIAVVQLIGTKIEAKKFSYR